MQKQTRFKLTLGAVFTAVGAFLALLTAFFLWRAFSPDRADMGGILFFGAIFLGVGSLFLLLSGIPMLLSARRDLRGR